MWTSERLIWLPFTTSPDKERILIDIHTIERVKELKAGGTVLIMHGSHERVTVLESYDRVVEIMQGAVNPK